MGQEDLLLRVEMGKLEIEPIKNHRILKDENPFIKTFNTKSNSYSRSHMLSQKCSCSLRKAQNKNIVISKKRNNQILKEPILKLLQTHSKISSIKTENNQPLSNNFHKISLPNLNKDVLNLCALVDNCNQLRISTDEKKKSVAESERLHKGKWWKNDILHMKQFKSAGVEKTQTGSCSQQALNPPCDVTIDELASYFETLVHIPKKMSSMAEMMYI